MRKKGSGGIAMAALCALCFGGILAMVSQDGKQPAAPAVADPSGLFLDPGPAASSDLGGIVPATLERGAILQAAEATKRVAEGGARLRLK